MLNAPFTIEVSYPATDVAVLRLAGELDLACDAELRQTLASIADPSATALIIDLAQARFIGVGVLADLVLAGRGFKTATLQSPNRMVTKVLALLNLPDTHPQDEHTTAPADADATNSTAA